MGDYDDGEQPFLPYPLLNFAFPGAVNPERAEWVGETFTLPCPRSRPHRAGHEPQIGQVTVDVRGEVVPPRVELGVRARDYGR